MKRRGFFGTIAGLVGGLFAGKRVEAARAWPCYRFEEKTFYAPREAFRLEVFEPKPVGRLRVTGRAGEAFSVDLTAGSGLNYRQAYDCVYDGFTGRTDYRFRGDVILDVTNIAADLPAWCYELAPLGVEVVVFAADGAAAGFTISLPNAIVVARSPSGVSFSARATAATGVYGDDLPTGCLISGGAFGTAVSFDKDVSRDDA